MMKEASEAIEEFSSSDAHLIFNGKEKDEAVKGQINDTLFTACLTSRDLPPEEKSVDRLAQEAFTFMGAGGETTARTLTTATFYTLLHKDSVLPRLKEELKSAMPDPTIPLDWKTAEQLPWLVSQSFELNPRPHR